MLLENQIDWNVFTQEERIGIQSCMDRGTFGDLQSVVQLGLPKEAAALEHAKIAELEKIKTLHGPRGVDKVSKVKEEHEAWLRENPKGIETQEQEKEWDDKFKKEREGWSKVEKVLSKEVRPQEEPKEASLQELPEQNKKRGRPKKVANESELKS